MNKLKNRFLKKAIVLSVLLTTLSLSILQCDQGYSPKPRGFIRIDLPGKDYRVFDSVMPYSFEYPVYAAVVKDPLEDGKIMYKRFNIEFPLLKGTLHLTYEPLVKSNLDTLIGDAVDFVYKHVPKATTITKSVISYNDRKVFGTLFNIRGKGTASTYQFYVTDSISHFMRGALYLNTEPNNDSLKTVIDFLKLDVDHFLNTLEWK